MTQAQFETNQPQCEFFLTCENIGFLLLSASGESYRKWQGLTVEDLSIFADLAWSFEHVNQEKFAQPHLNARALNLKPQERLWLKTTRRGGSVERAWRLGCGCEMTESWQWPEGSQQLEVQWLWTSNENCSEAPNTSARLQVLPRWTLCPPGFAQAGGGHAQINFDPRKKMYLEICSESLPHQTILVHGLCHSEQRGDEYLTSAWDCLVDVHLEEIPTPADERRGENRARLVLLTHKTEINVAPHQMARLLIEFKLEGRSAALGRARRAEDSGSAVSHGILAQENDERGWAKAFTVISESLNQLVRRRSDGKLGLQAGLPWFTQFWTRDTCHSFRAAFLWAGRVTDGEEVLCELWAASDGVVPNYTTTTATTNNSADALPLLLLSTADLVDVHGMSKKIDRQREKILAQLRWGSQRFLQGHLMTHGPADTWMDAQKTSPQGHLIACSPRADRAFEIQAFWVAALARWSVILEETSHSKFEDVFLFRSAARQGLRLMRKLFLNREKKRWADHLHSDGTQDLSLRPNGILGFAALLRADMLFDLMTHEEIADVVNEFIEADLIVSYGVRTLSPDTPLKHPMPLNTIFAEQTAYIHENKIHFHPYHEFGSRHGLEHPDWAYHNGTIWPWLSHAAIQLLCLAGRSDVALQLTQTLAWHANHGTEGGALAELLDGLSSGSPWSWPKGAPHQAWSEAAFVHMIVEEWIGIWIKNCGRTIEIKTKNWNILGNFSFEFSHQDCRILVERNSDECFVRIVRAGSSDNQFDVRFVDISSEFRVSTQVHRLSQAEPVSSKLTFS